LRFEFPDARDSAGAVDKALANAVKKSPWWSLSIFALCVYILHGLIVFGEEKPAQT
jgi:hypothetical protein